MLFRLKHLLSPESSGRTTAPETSQLFPRASRENSAPAERSPSRHARGRHRLPVPLVSPPFPCPARPRHPTAGSGRARRRRAVTAPAEGPAAPHLAPRRRGGPRCPPPRTRSRKSDRLPGAGGSRRRAPRGGRTTAVLGRRPRHEGNSPRRRKRLTRAGDLPLVSVSSTPDFSRYRRNCSRLESAA